MPVGTGSEPFGFIKSFWRKWSVVCLKPSWIRFVQQYHKTVKKSYQHCHLLVVYRHCTVEACMFSTTAVRGSGRERRTYLLQNGCRGPQHSGVNLWIQTESSDTNKLQIHLDVLVSYLPKDQKQNKCLPIFNESVWGFTLPEVSCFSGISQHSMLCRSRWGAIGFIKI